jgi:predicted DNA-binding transcriptional regulator
VRFWTIAVPVFVASIAILGIGAWIGWTMATTPPPKPIEEIQSKEEETGKEQANA